MGLCEQVEDGEIVEDASEPAKEVASKDGGVDEGAGNSTPTLSERKPSNWSRRDNNQRMVKFFPLSPFLLLVGFLRFVLYIQDGVGCFSLDLNFVMVLSNVIRTLKSPRQSMFPEYCPKMRILAWLTETKGCWASYLGPWRYVQH